MKVLICKDTSTTDSIIDKLHLEVPESEADFTPEWCERVLRSREIIDDDVKVEFIRLLQLA